MVSPSTATFGQGFCKSSMPKYVRRTIVPFGNGIPLRALKYPIIATLNSRVEIIPVAVSLQFNVLSPRSIASDPIHFKSN